MSNNSVNVYFNDVESLISSLLLFSLMPTAHHHECHTDHITHPVTACGSCCNKLKLSISNGKFVKLVCTV